MTSDQQPQQKKPKRIESIRVFGGKATFSYGASPLAGEAHIIWRRIDGHEIFDEP
jgi:hypothetical protein